MSKDAEWFSKYEELPEKYTRMRNIREGMFPPNPEIAAKMHLSRWYAF